MWAYLTEMMITTILHYTVYNKEFSNLTTYVLRSNPYTYKNHPFRSLLAIPHLSQFLYAMAKIIILAKYLTQDFLKE